MPHGLSEIEFCRLLSVFKANERVEKVVLYGSRARGDYKPFSDIDVTICGNELSHRDLRQIIVGVDDLLLPYQVDVSLFHSLRNEALIESIRREGIDIFCR